MTKRKNKRAAKAPKPGYKSGCSYATRSVSSRTARTITSNPGSFDPARRCLQRYETKDLVPVLNNPKTTIRRISRHLGSHLNEWQQGFIDGLKESIRAHHEVKKRFRVSRKQATCLMRILDENNRRDILPKVKQPRPPEKWV